MPPGGTFGDVFPTTSITNIGSAFALSNIPISSDFDTGASGLDIETGTKGTGFVSRGGAHCSSMRLGHLSLCERSIVYLLGSLACHSTRLS